MSDRPPTPPPPPPGEPAATAAAGEGGRPPRRPPVGRRPVRRAGGEDAKPQAVRCPRCNARVEVRDRDGTVMVVCGSCGTALDVSVPGAARELHRFEETRRQAAGNPIALGAKGSRKGRTWEAIGRIRWVQEEDGQAWWWDETQLRSDDGRYAFLTLENGHWTWSEPLRRRITVDPRFASPGSRIRPWETIFKVYERGNCRVEYVEGELTWVAAKGDRLEFVDAVAAPEMLSAEWTEQEMEWSIGKWLPPDRVAEIFGLEAKSMPRPQGVAPHQPFEQDANQKARVILGSFAAMLLLLVAIVAGVWPGERVLVTRVAAADYLSEQGATTPSFRLPEGNNICKLELRSEDLDNSWVALDVGVIDEEEKVLLEAEATVERYSGRDSEGSWSEGSKKRSKLMRLPGGTYRLALFGASGTWPESPTTPAHDVQVVLRRGVFPVRYALLAAIVAVLLPLKEGARLMAHRAAQAPETDD